LHLVETAVHFGLGYRHGLVARSEEARHLWRVLDQVVGLVRQVGLHQDITREELALGVDLLPAADFDHFLSRHQDFLEQVVQPVLLRPAS
jgi:hypothetical protein